MLSGTVRLFRVRSVPVGVNWSWLLVFVLVFSSLAAVVFPARYPGLTVVSHVLMAVVATVLFFVSVLVHELSHTLVAVRNGVRVREITLWLLGGASRTEEPLPTPRVELRVVAAGPAASAVLALVFWGLAVAIGATGVPEAVRASSEYLARINGLLLAFNVVPALPLDGGRLLHAVLWRRSGDRSAATISAARPGLAFGFVLITIGLFDVLGEGAMGGVWLVLMGWFFFMAVQGEIFAAQIEQAVTGLRVRDLMAADPVAVAPSATIDEVAQGPVRRSPHGAYPVVEQGHLVGLLPRRRVSAMARRGQGGLALAEVMLTDDQVPKVGPDDEVAAALGSLRRSPGRAVVVEPNGDSGGRVVGVLTAGDIQRAVEVAPRRPAVRPRNRLGGALATWGVVALLIALAGLLYHPPYAVIEPGRAFDIRDDITISGVPLQEPSGAYVLASVRVTRPSALELLVDVFRTDREVVPLADVVPSGISPGDLEDVQRRMFLESQQMAAAAGATAAGYDAEVTGSGAEVVGFAASSPAASTLEVGDVITAVDGAPVSTVGDLEGAVTGRAPGERFDLTVERAGDTVHRSVESSRRPHTGGATGIGVLVLTRDLHVALPFRISFGSRPEVGGPSAGLAYALAIADMLDRGDAARSRSIAATGTIAEDGAIGPVGGVHEKAVAAQDAGADVFIAPAGELSAVDRTGLETRGAHDLTQVLDLLRST